MADKHEHSDFGKGTSTTLPRRPRSPKLFSGIIRRQSPEYDKHKGIIRHKSPEYDELGEQLRKYLPREHLGTEELFNVLQTEEIIERWKSTDPDSSLQQRDDRFPSLESFASKKELEIETDTCLQQGNTPTQEYLSMAITFYGRKHYMVAKLCDAVTKRILGLSEKIKTVTASYTKSKDLVFVIHHEDIIDPDLHDAAVRYQVYFRNVNCVSKEAEMVSQRDNYGTEKLSKEENLNLKKVISQRSPDLFRDHCNLNVISSSRVKSSGFMGSEANLSEQLCIVLYVSVKGFIPLAEEELPTEIGGYKTDVIEGRFTVFHKPANEKHEDLKAGCQIHCPVSDLTGTIGPFVAFENKLCFLTCCHMICKDEVIGELIVKYDGGYNFDETDNIPVYQPNCISTEASKEIGKVIKLMFKKGDTSGNAGIDVAVVEITDRHPITGTFPKCSASTCMEIGYSCPSELVYSGDACSGHEDLEPGLAVVMFGSQSGLTRGILRTNGTAVRTTDFVIGGSPYTLYNQLEISGICNSAGTPFAKIGDSGALVFLKKGNGPLVAVGLLVGGTLSGQYMATPIWEIYDAIKCSPIKFNENASLSSQSSVKGKSASKEFDEFRTEVTHKVDDLREYIDTRFNAIDSNIKALTSFLEKNFKEPK